MEYLLATTNRVSLDRLLIEQTGWPEVFGVKLELVE